MDYQKTARSVLAGLGGADNVAYFTHCATRLRVTLNDKSKVEKSAIEKTDGVLSVIEQSGQTQVVIGNEVANVYDEMAALPGMAKDEGQGGSSAAQSTKGSKGGVITRMFDVLSDSFRPVLWALLGSSMILTLIVLLQQLGVFGQYTNFAGQVVNVDLVNGPKLGDDAANSAMLNDWRAQFPFWFILLGAALSVLNFMPIFIGATAAKRLGANMWVGAAIPAALMTDAFRGLATMADGADHITLFHIGEWGVPLYLFNYTGQVFPPLFAVAVLAPLERLLKKIIPNMLHMVFVPMISILIMVPLTALVIGPIGVNLGLGISNVFQWLNGINPAIVGVVVAGAYLFMVPLGLHWPLNAVMISNLSTLGYDFIQSPMAAYNFAVFGVVTGVAIRAAKDKELRQVATGAAISGLLGGISEPSLYGVVLRFKRVFPLILVPAMIAGGLISSLGVKSYAFAFTSLLSIPAMQPVPLFAIGLAVAYFGGMAGVIIFGFRSKAQREEDLAKQTVPADEVPTEEKTQAGLAQSEPARTPQHSAAHGAAPAGAAAATATLTNEVTVGLPLEGTVVPLNEVPDPIFAGGKLGQGVAVRPTAETVVAPEGGTVIATPSSGHALGLRLDSGVELLIHVGIDTVNLQGRGFTAEVSKGDVVQAGQKLLTFDRSVIDEAGYDAITPVLVTNTSKYQSVTATGSGPLSLGDPVITVVPR
ncbi:glucose PTS transporter subunit IIA [Kocuria massiliensis]|uniref:glucose PTS transporter subunit IIA n=1 Tax=Kocuria massiliensis TaxID=1926282 RepID=UPI000A1CA6A8|nr:glucose PTS transporter subunit IIA [Kocuria massiliensis]